MKRFLKITGIYLAIGLFVFFPAILFFTKGVGEDVDLAMELAKKKYSFKIKKIRLGDSVGKQIWKTGYDSTTGEVNLTSNQAISVLGHIMLLKSILLNNETDSTLVIEGYFKPSSIAFNDLNQLFSRGYFLKKFYNKDWFFNTDVTPNSATMALIDEEFLAQYKERKLYDFFYVRDRCLLAHPCFFEKGNYDNNKTAGHLYELLMPELKKIKFISNPLSLTHKENELKAYNELIRSMAMTPPVFLEDSIFIEDKTHLKEPFREKGYQYLMQFSLPVR